MAVSLNQVRKHRATRYQEYRIARTEEAIDEMLMNCYDEGHELEIEVPTHEGDEPAVGELLARYRMMGWKLYYRYSDEEGGNVVIEADQN